MPRTHKTLRALRVLDRLTVGPVELKPDRLSARYQVRVGNQTAETRLSYKWGEPVFDPEALADRNLASLVAAQVALNYGLFAREIVLHGPLHATDQRFLEEMARNTAREILVLKILEPNPFLVDGLQPLEPPDQRDFLQAKLRFPDAAQAADLPRIPWETDRRRHAVLASGGKDSLLSHGLLDEIGREVHSLFVNESGRHWYTALNAFRHFDQHVPHTARVWTNADRVFTFMLRQIPLVRPDFASLRADIYPLRLWTVAVFLFGALPLVRRRGIARIVIGDEHDTSLRLRHRGIPHYGGLYDQSRWFDDALSRFYSRKGWGISQFSILRPLSDLLIEKVLARRYPALLQLQTSCHATHLVGERALPCGKCEKCRRIIGMLVALGEDPAVCGYTPAQVEPGLVSLTRLGAHQEEECTHQVLELLREQNKLPAAATLPPTLRPHPEVMQLRFHPERSPLDGIPVDLRAPLVRLLLEHADGAVRRSGRDWREVDPLDPDILAAPYRFERPRPATDVARPRGTGPHPSDSSLLADLTWPEAQRRFTETDVALLPVGALEQHGPHLPLDVDAYDADRLCREVADRCPPPRPLVLPAIPYGVSYHHEGFAGTVSIDPQTLAQLVYEVGCSVARHGVVKLILVNGHGGNSPALHLAAQRINRDAHIFTCVETGETSDEAVEALAETSNDVHAGEIETSTTLALRPEVVRLQRARARVPHFSSDFLEFSSRRSVGWYARTALLSEDGTLGDPTRASVEKGQAMWTVMVDQLHAFVRDLQAMSLEDLYDRRY